MEMGGRCGGVEMKYVMMDMVCAVMEKSRCGKNGEKDGGVS